ncbi:MAG: aminodeoxychorismate synthase component I [Proteobacteria bacterium]|nr:aminodeoxychorismate synthase component I [Pseudomonadota bacterium]
MFQPSSRIALAAIDQPAKPADWLRVVADLHDDPGFWWLDSALPDARLGRFSFAGSDPYLRLEARGEEIDVEVRRNVRPGLAPGTQRIKADPIEFARSLLPRTDSLIYSTRAAGAPGTSGPEGPSGSGGPQWHEVAGLSPGLELPFLGGAVGYLGYELAATLEPKIDLANADDLGLPDLSLAFVDHVLAYDHSANRLWILGLGFSDSGASGDSDARVSSVSRSRHVVDGVLDRLEPILSQASSHEQTTHRTAASETSFPILSTADASAYAKAIDTILQEIEAGNVYQANFSQCLTMDAPVDPWSIYQALRRHNPAPFGAYLSQTHSAILSSSPERFLRLDGSRRVESRPIKGTRPRGQNDLEDLRLSDELSRSEKDRAENLMIVDLVRNDLGRVCAPGSISVPALMEIEAYAEVLQMVSTVTGTLATGRDAFDLVRATFPPGSMTGAPKLAAIGLLERLEQVKRGVYAGALGYFDLRGGLDLSVVIRTIVWKDDRAHLHVGGGVVADSTPTAEYLESLDEAKAPLAALEEVLVPKRRSV